MKMPRWSPFEPYFWGLVKKQKGCWLWLGGCDGRGYGRIWYQGKRCRAHRVAYELTLGGIPDGLCVCHHCDNKICVNPDHFFVGTHTDNMRDCTDKGRNYLINHRELWSNGRHMKKSSVRKKLSNSMKEQFDSGKRIVIHDEQGRLVGTRIVDE